MFSSIVIPSSNKFRGSSYAGGSGLSSSVASLHRPSDCKGDATDSVSDLDELARLSASRPNNIDCSSIDESL